MIEIPTPKFRAQAQFPAEHMRLIGEICVYWTSMELCILQAICEPVNIKERDGQYLGSNIPTGIRFDMLQAMGTTLKETPKTEEKGKQLLKLLQVVRNAYVLRNKYAHAHIRTHGPDKTPDIHFARTTRHLHFENRPLPLSEIVNDADEIYDACVPLINFLQDHGFCTKAWS
jgi:hypothetical protein